MANAHEDLGRYEAGYTSTEDQTVDIPTQGAHITFSKDEVIHVMFSNKVNMPFYLPRYLVLTIANRSTPIMRLRQ